MPSRRLDEYFRQLGAAARSRQVDIEALLRRAIEEAVEETLRRTGAGAPAGEGIEELRREIVELRREVESLRREIAARGHQGAAGLSPAERRLIEELPRAVAEAVAAVLQKHCIGGKSINGGGNEPRWLRAVRERLGSRGYLFVHELPPDVQAEFDPEAARRNGLVVAPLAGGYLVATRETFNEFIEKLRGLKTSDEYEAEAKLGRYRLLFRILRGEGALYYGGPSRGWVLSLKT